MNVNELRNFIHHSDRGVQYASYKYTSILKDYKMYLLFQRSYNQDQIHLFSKSPLLSTTFSTT